MIEAIEKELIAGRFSRSLPHCEVRQCGAERPWVFTGPAFVDQDADGRLLLRMFATEELSLAERAEHSVGQHLTPGVLMPDDTYYDVEARDQRGTIWRAARQTVEKRFDLGNELRIHLLHFESVQDAGAGGTAGAAWFIPGKFELPWHESTETERGGFRVDRFGSEVGDLGWTAHKRDDGLEVGLRVKGPALEPHATRFLQALSMLIGQALTPLVSYTSVDGQYVTRIHAPSKPAANVPRAQLVCPLPIRIYEQGDAHTFLSRCLQAAVSYQPEPAETLRILYQFWYRILRAHQADIENSSLVLSVAIEGVVKALCFSQEDGDPEFADLAEQSKPKIEDLDIDVRVKDALMSSLKHSVTPKPKGSMSRLLEQGVITKVHIDAWNRMRNTGAHGTLLEDDQTKFQQHLNRYFACLDLFYRLMFIAIGYRGNHIDYSSTGWPTRGFLSAKTATAVSNENPAPTETSTTDVSRGASPTSRGG